MEFLVRVFRYKLLCRFVFGFSTFLFFITWFELPRLSRIVALQSFTVQEVTERYLSAVFFSPHLTLQLTRLFLEAKPQLPEKLNSKGRKLIPNCVPSDCIPKAQSQMDLL